MRALEPALLLVAMRTPAFQDPVGTEVRVALNGDSELIMDRCTSPAKTVSNHRFPADALASVHDLLCLLSKDEPSNQFTTGSTLKIHFRSATGDVVREIPEPDRKEKRPNDQNFMAAWRAIHSPYAAIIQKYKK